MVDGQSKADNQSIESMVVRGRKTRQDKKPDQTKKHVKKQVGTDGTELLTL
jgi:hypothetical protein